MLCALIKALPVVAAIMLLMSHNAHGSPSGPPLSACQALTPFGHLRGGRYTSQDLGFGISAPDVFAPGETINIQISGNRDFRGIIMQVRANNVIPTGVFQNIPSDFRIVHCTRFPRASTIGHTNRKDKDPSTTVFTWEAPDACIEGGPYVIRATIVQHYTDFQEGLSKTIICRAPTTTTEQVVTTTTTEATTTETAEPERAFPMCVHSSRTSIPDGKYTTSFEDGEGLNGWVNRRGWAINSGPTPTEGTGPDAAADGENYLYYEANVFTSKTRRPVLVSARDLRGCFCLSLKHSHNVMDNTGHNFIITAGSRRVYSTMAAQKDWTELKFQMDFLSFVRIRIVERRGTNALGDTAIDDITISPGQCSDDEEEEEGGEGEEEGEGEEGGMEEGGEEEGGEEGDDENMDP